MILVDVNLLVYASVSSMAQHARSRQWLDSRLNGIERIGLPWPALVGFVRLVTNPRVFAQPVGVQTAWNRVEEWLTRPNVWTPVPTDRHATVLGHLVRATGAHGNLIHDAHMAALAIEHGLTMCSTDADFARFPGLRWENPIS